jgi:hypothetical protein
MFGIQRLGCPSYLRSVSGGFASRRSFATLSQAAFHLSVSSGVQCGGVSTRFSGGISGIMRGSVGIENSPGNGTCFEIEQSGEADTMLFPKAPSHLGQL